MKSNTTSSTVMESVEEIAQNAITVDSGLQMRVCLDPEVVDEYHRVILAANGWPFPPVVIFRDELGVNRLVDGFHRYAASLRPCRIFRLPAIVHRGSRVDALRFALLANAQHGLMRSRADIRKSVRLSLEAFPSFSDRTIGNLVGCPKTTVTQIRLATSRTPSTSPAGHEKSTCRGNQ
jgi:hypothetical protein